MALRSEIGGLPVAAGHRAGSRALRPIVEAAIDLGVQSLAVYAFSTENWARPRTEVRALMRLFHEAIQREIDELDERGIRLVVSGRRGELSDRMRQRIDAAEQRTAGNRRGVLNVCLNYGGRAEVVDAVRRLVLDGVPAAEVDEAAIAARHYHPDLPQPDLIIRTAGEKRTSNFLLWQSAYSELYLTDTLWPDFDRAALELAVAEYARRVRRFGGRPDLEVVGG